MLIIFQKLLCHVPSYPNIVNTCSTQVGIFQKFYDIIFFHRLILFGKQNGPTIKISWNLFFFKSSTLQIVKWSENTNWTELSRNFWTFWPGFVRLRQLIKEFWCQHQDAKDPAFANIFDTTIEIVGGGMSHDGFIWVQSSENVLN